MTCEACVDAIKSVLKDVSGIESIEVSLASEQVVVDTTLSCHLVQELIESTQRKAVLLGAGPANGKAINVHTPTAAVVIISGLTEERGVIRFIQLSPVLCLIDGTVDGLVPGRYVIAIHEFGDLQDNFDKCGDVFVNESGSVEKPYGDLGEIIASDNGRAQFRIENRRIQIYDVIGRSVIIHQLRGDSSALQRVAGGIIARSSGLFDNSKRICACSGRTLWEERGEALNQTTVTLNNHSTL